MQFIFALLIIAISQVYSQAGVTEILPETQVTTCGCFSGVSGGRNQRYCGTNCNIAKCPASTPCPLTVFGDPIDTEVRWGDSTTMGQPNSQSGMGFTGEFNKVVPLNAEFFVGRLTHFNHPIIGPAQSTDLTVQLIVPEFNIEQDFTFTLVIDETPNNENNGPCPYPSTTPCSDKITFNLAGFDFSKKFTVGGAIEYTLRLTGFKETRVSQSRSTSNFISNEKRENNAFLFAEVVAACPDSCQGGGTPEIIQRADGSQYCGCNCPAGAATACQRPLELQADCSCTCPKARCNGYPGDPNNNCACMCPNPMQGMGCAAPKSEWDAEKCVCKCPASICGQGFLADPDTCGCECAGVECPNGATPDTANGCQCVCQKTCGPDQILDQTLCQCVCDPTKNVCDAAFNWEVDPNNQAACRCGCANQCGSGCAAAGAIQECTDDGNQCCTNCKLTPNEPCDDGDQCTVNDRCQGEPVSCRGDPKCPQPLDTCTEVQCNPTTGECTEVRQPDGSACGTVGTAAADFDKCRYACEEGLCVRIVPPDCSITDEELATLGNLGQCSGKFCNPRTGECKLGIEDKKPCNDNDLCTFDDQCTPAGECVGTPNPCDGSGGELLPDKTCHVYQCDKLLGACLPVPAPFDSPCVEDPNDKCKTAGTCSGGVCLSGKKCKRLKGDEAQCATQECDPATGACVLSNRDVGSPCILPSGFARTEDFCGSNYTCDGTGNCTRGFTNPDRANHSKCAPPLIANDFSQNIGGIVGGAVGGTLLVMIIAALLTYCFVQQKALLDPSTWQAGPEVGLESNPLYDDANAGVNNPLYNG